MVMPFFDPSIGKKMRWREGDIVVNGGIKSGTHWTMNIVYQLMSGGNGDFMDLYEELPWLELIEYPGQETEERIARWDKVPGRRAFKSHMSADKFIHSPLVKQIIVIREGKEVVNSMLPFVNGIAEDFKKWWGGGIPKFTSYDQTIDMLDKTNEFHGHCLTWWERRNESNVMLVHYADLKKDLEGCIRKIAKFIEVPQYIDESKMPQILEHCSFAWMKEHEAQIEGFTRLKIHIYAKTGNLLRAGKLGSYSEDFTPEMQERFDQINERKFPDPAMRDWVKNGGPLPC